VESPDRCTASAEVDWDSDPLVDVGNHKRRTQLPLFAAIFNIEFHALMASQVRTF
jgi:hypothetical protein